METQRRQRERGGSTYPLLKLLMYGIQSVLDGYAFEVPCCYFQPQWEVQVNLLDRWCCKHQLEVGRVVHCGRRRVDLPAKRAKKAQVSIRQGLKRKENHGRLPSQLLGLLGDLELNALSLCCTCVRTESPIAGRCGESRRSFDEGEGERKSNLPRSLTFNTPGWAIELARRLDSLVSFAGDDRPWTAESTLLSGSDILNCSVGGRQMGEGVLIKERSVSRDVSVRDDRRSC